MAKKLREIVVAVTADTAAYQREMNRVSRMGANYFRSTEEGARRADAAYQRNTGSLRQQSAAVNDATAAIAGYARAAAGLFAGAQLIGYADAWGQISSRLKIATDGQQAFVEAQDRLMNISGRVYKQYDQTAELFIRSNESLQQLGYTSSEALDLVEAFSYGLTVSSTSSQKAATAVDALSKAIQTGKLSMDQYDSLIAAAPRLQKALADSIGVTNAALRQMVADGKLTTDQLMKLTTQTEKMGREADLMPVTMADAYVRLTNELQKYVGEANEAHGVTLVLTDGINLLSDNIGAVVEIGAAAAVGALAGKMIEAGRAASSATSQWLAARGALVGQARAAMQATAAQADHARMQLEVAKANVAAATGMQRLALVQRELIPAQARYAAVTEAATAAQVRFNSVSNLGVAAGRSLLAALGGPAGLAITVAGLAAGWLMFRDSADEATRAIRDMSGPLDEVIKKYRDLNEQQRDQARRQARDQLDDARSAMQYQLERLSGAAVNAGTQSSVGALETFRSTIAAINADTSLTANEASRQIQAQIEAYVKATPIGAGYRDQLVDIAAAYSKNREEVDRYSGRLAAMNGEQDAAAEGAAGLGSALASVASGMAAADWAKYLKNLETARDLIGLSVRQAAEYKARSDGANDAQAQLAGTLALQAATAEDLRKATEDKDAKAITGAKATLAELVRVEAQQRAIIASAAEAARLQSQLARGFLTQEGFSQMVGEAYTKAYDSAFDEGTQRTGRQVADIAANTKPGKGAAKAANDWAAWVRERQAETAAQQRLAKAYLDGAQAVEQATVANAAEAEVLRYGASRRSEIVKLLDAEGRARAAADASKQIADMGREIALIDAKTEAERVLWEVQNGAYVALDEHIRKALVGRAQELDLARKAAAQRGYIGEITGRADADIAIEKMGWLADAFDRGQISAEQMKRAVADLTGEGLDQLTEFSIQGARNVQTYLGDSLYQGVTGKFDGIGTAFADMLARMASEAAGANIGGLLFGDFGRSNQIGGLFGSLGTAVSGWFGGGAAGSGDPWSKGFMPVTYSALGNAFSAGQLVPFARGGAFSNGVVNAPVAFPMGVMGEAGPEAIVPLHRGRDGSLGVRMQLPDMGSGGGGPVSNAVEVNVFVQPGGQPSVEAPDAYQQFGQGVGEDVLRRLMDERIARAFMPGGAAWSAQTSGYMVR
ncbi:tape measure protein [Bordetella bronchiseptica]|uniref:tape measure protein n=1 Tax=Bordetella bronchiseptica TaxID=518 RepID=UPI0005283FAE|nr:tape measure protein [Bordetella bronchiseptica]